MYNMDQVTFSDSKYTVADILSSMASGQPLTPTLSTNFSVINSMATPTLTPTTLASLERTFIEMPHAQDLTVPRTRSGFVPPVIDPVSRMDGSDPDWVPVTVSKKSKTSSRPTYSVAPYQVPTPPAPRRGGGRRSKDDPRLSPEELRRRQVRRERNKLAAAKCRQRRVDHTNELINETEELEEETSSLENQIKTLQQQKEQLEFLLHAHKPMCKAPEKIKVDDSEEKPSRPQTLPILKPVVVKQEPSDSSDIGIPITTPSTGMFSFSLDSLEGRTGLTPMSEGLMRSGLTPTCSAQQRNSSDSSPDVLNSPTLISL